MPSATTTSIDPLSQEEYFRLFAFFNNTQDADRGDESPTMPGRDGRAEAPEGGAEGARSSALERTLETPDARDLGRPGAMGEGFDAELDWQTLKPDSVTSAKGPRSRSSTIGRSGPDRKGKADVDHRDVAGDRSPAHGPAAGDLAGRPSRKAGTGSS